MCASRTCRPCKNAKIKCDLQRPLCGACSKRHINCYGYVSDSEYLFRNQNETAKVNSQRARRVLTNNTRKKSLRDAPVPADATVSGGDILSTNDDLISLYRKAVPWLKAQALTSLPSPILHKLEDRTLDIFYVEWIVKPNNCGRATTPGYLDLLPLMKARATSSSALNLAVEAFALANVRHLKISDDTLTQKALAKYGAALAAIRSAMMQDSLATDDSTLMAILTIDMFEIVFMVRDEPLGLHSNAIEYLLTARGPEQILTATGYALYQMANNRLQTRQFGLDLDPLPVQLACVDMFDTSKPSLNLGAVHLRAQQTLSVFRGLFSTDPWGLLDSEQLSLLSNSIQRHLSELEQWKTNLPASWKPKRVGLAEQRKDLQALMATSLPLSTQIWLYGDPCIAYHMTFFSQSQLALRAALLNVMEMMKTYATNEFSLASLEQEVSYQEMMILQVADTLAESIIPLVSSALPEDANTVGSSGKKITQCFARAICWTLQRAKFVPIRHKEFANQVENWMRHVNNIV